MVNIFPIGIATGATFCNRVSERKILKTNIITGKHSVVLAPRGYDKTSLITQTLNEANLLYCEIDFLLTATPEAVQQRILEKVGKLLLELLPKTKKAKEKILHLFKSLRPDLVLSGIGQKIIFHAPPSEHMFETTICDTLVNLDKAAQLAKKRVVVFMDEFQQIGDLKDQHVVEASIRHAVERSQNVSYIFSGSNRHMLLQMFSSKSRPFYRLCTTITIKRIKEEDHIHFIQDKATKKWKKRLTDDAINEIMKTSDCHDYYVSLICKYFWDKNQIPTPTKIQEFWKHYIDTQQAVIAYDIALLSNNQKIVLNEFAKNPTNQPYAHKCLMRTKLTLASQKEAINKLMRKDFVYVDDLGITRLLDPAIRTLIKRS
ncbi:MAG: hypothetical protein ACE365_00145 [Gammaproteobacteria bacterium]